MFKYQKNKMKIKLLVTFMFFALFVNAQDKQSKIYNSTELKKGFYKSYEEYVNNNPSITYDFKTTYLTASGTNKTIIQADYTLIETDKKTGKVWGFCDGKDIFIRFTTGLVYGKFWKVGYNGIMPFFYYNQSQTHGFAPGLMGLVTLAATSTLEPVLQMYVKEIGGGYTRVTKHSFKRMLKKEPALQKEFLEKMKNFESDDEQQNKLSNKEIDKLRFEIYKEFLIKFNQTKQLEK